MMKTIRHFWHSRILDAPAHDEAYHLWQADPRDIRYLRCSVRSCNKVVHRYVLGAATPGQFLRYRFFAWQFKIRYPRPEETPQ